MENLLNIDLKSKIAEILSVDYESRDNDNRLLSIIWRNECQHNNLESFFSELQQGKISNFESIRRARQKLQEERPSLRGNRYLYRQTRSEQIRNNINKCNDTVEILEETPIGINPNYLNTKPVSIFNFVGITGFKKIIKFLIENNPKREPKIIRINNRLFLIEFNEKKYAYEFYII